jgi:hypothetical protein
VRADPRGFVRVNVIGEVRRARQEAGVRFSREPGGDIRCVPQEPHFLARADGDRAGLHGDAHGPLELVERQREPAVPGRHHHEVAGLIGGDQNRQAQLREERGQTFRVGTADIAVFLDRFRSSTRHAISRLNWRDMVSGLTKHGGSLTEPGEPGQQSSFDWLGPVQDKQEQRHKSAWHGFLHLRKHPVS